MYLFRNTRLILELHPTNLLGLRAEGKRFVNDYLSKLILNSTGWNETYPYVSELKVNFLYFFPSQNRIPLLEACMSLLKKSEASKCIQQMWLSRVNATPAFCSCFQKRQVCDSKNISCYRLLLRILFEKNLCLCCGRLY